MTCCTIGLLPIKVDCVLTLLHHNCRSLGISSKSVIRYGKRNLNLPRSDNSHNWILLCAYRTTDIPLPSCDSTVLISRAVCECDSLTCFSSLGSPSKVSHWLDVVVNNNDCLSVLTFYSTIISCYSQLNRIFSFLLKLDFSWFKIIRHISSPLPLANCNNRVVYGSCIFNQYWLHRAV